jgi:hypothetical protein
MQCCQYIHIEICLYVFVCRLGYCTAITWQSYLVIPDLHACVKWLHEHSTYLSADLVTVQLSRDNLTSSSLTCMSTAKCVKWLHEHSTYLSVNLVTVQLSRDNLTSSSLTCMSTAKCVRWLYEHSTYLSVVLVTVHPSRDHPGSLLSL